MNSTIKISRRILCILLCLLLVFAISSTSALAAPKGNAYGSGTNDKYEAATAYFQQWDRQAAALSINIKDNELKKLAKIYADKHGNQENFMIYLTDWTNAKIDRQVALAQKSRCDDTDLLLEQVDFLVANVLYWGSITGYDVECIYVAYIVDNQTVLIDPLRVVNTRR